MSRRTHRVVAALLFAIVFFTLQPFYRDAPLKMIPKYNGPSIVEDQTEAPVDAPVDAPRPPAVTLSHESEAPPIPSLSSWAPPLPLSPLSPPSLADDLPPLSTTHNDYSFDDILQDHHENPDKYAKDPELMVKYIQHLGWFHDALRSVRAVIKQHAVANRRRLQKAKLHVAGVRNEEYDYVVGVPAANTAALLAANSDHVVADVGYRDRAGDLKRQYWNRTDVSDTTPFSDTPYWMPSMMEGGGPKNSSNSTSTSAYTVWRDVRAYGAKGDGLADDTAAITRAIRDGNRCVEHKQRCVSTEEVKPAVVYFPPGIYLISGAIDVFYGTQLLGDPTDRPTILVSSAFLGYAAIRTNVDDGHVPLDHAMRSIRNLVIDMTNAPVDNSLVGIYWEVAQSSDFRNVDIYMTSNADAASAQANTQIGLYMLNGRGCFLSDVYLQGGRVSAHLNVEHFTVSNMIVADAQVAVVVPGRSRVGLDLLHGLTVVSAPGTHARGMRGDNDSPPKPDVAVGVAIDALAASYIIRKSLVITDSVFVNVAVAIAQIGYPNAHMDDDHAEYKPHATTVLLRGKTNGETLAVPAWRLQVSKHEVVNKVFEDTAIVEDRPASLTVQRPGDAKKQNTKQRDADRTWFSDWWDWWQDKLGGGKGAEDDDNKEDDDHHNMSPWVTRSLPTYTHGHYEFVDVKSFGAVGDGTTDDTKALQKAIDEAAAAANKVLFVPHGVYVVTRTLHVPANSRIVGQAWPTIEGRGAYFDTPQYAGNVTLGVPPVVRVGHLGGNDKGIVEISDMTFSIKYRLRSASLVEWNMYSSSSGSSDDPSGPGGMWNCHFHLNYAQSPLALWDGSSAYIENMGMSLVAGPLDPNDLHGDFDFDAIPPLPLKDANYDFNVDERNNPKAHLIPRLGTMDIFIGGQGPHWLWGNGGHKLTLFPLEAAEACTIYVGGDVVDIDQITVTKGPILVPGKYTNKDWAKLQEEEDRLIEEAEKEEEEGPKKPRD